MIVAQNGYNRKLNKNNKCGIKGIHWDQSRDLWFAQIQVNGKPIFVGRFKNIKDAELAIRSKREQVHGDFANHGLFLDIPNFLRTKQREMFDDQL